MIYACAHEQSETVSTAGPESTKPSDARGRASGKVTKGAEGAWPGDRLSTSSFSARANGVSFALARIHLIMHKIAQAGMEAQRSRGGSPANPDIRCMVSEGATQARSYRMSRLTATSLVLVPDPSAPSCPPCRSENASRLLDIAHTTRLWSAYPAGTTISLTHCRPKVAQRDQPGDDTSTRSSKVES